MSEMPSSCSVVRPLLARYFDYGSDRPMLEAHIAGCADCRAEFESILRQIRELPCQELVELASRYVEGDLGTHAEGRVSRHLQLCGGCSEYVRELHRTIELLGSIDQAPSPAAIEQSMAGLLAAFRARYG